jgi:hypothetical protein
VGLSYRLKHDHVSPLHAEVGLSKACDHVAISMVCLLKAPLLLILPNPSRRSHDLIGRSDRSWTESPKTEPEALLIGYSSQQAMFSTLLSTSDALSSPTDQPKIAIPRLVSSARERKVMKHRRRVPQACTAVRYCLSVFVQLPEPRAVHRSPCTSMVLQRSTNGPSRVKCRTHKIKCTGARPYCESCANIGRECVYGAPRQDRLKT